MTIDDEGHLESRLDGAEQLEVNMEERDSVLRPYGIKTGVSFKDSLMNQGSESENTVRLFGVGKVKEFDVMDSDMIIGEEDGMPTIDFSDRVHRILIQSLETAIVVKLFGEKY